MNRVKITAPKNQVFLGECERQRPLSEGGLIRPPGRLFRALLRTVRIIAEEEYSMDVRHRVNADACPSIPRTANVYTHPKVYLFTLTVTDRQLHYGNNLVPHLDFTIFTYSYYRIQQISTMSWIILRMTTDIGRIYQIKRNNFIGIIKGAILTVERVCRIAELQTHNLMSRMAEVHVS
jgi:hypothetical protein